MSKKILLILVLLILVMFEPIGQNTYDTHYTNIDHKHLKILSWNIYMLPYISLINGNTKRASLIADKLQNSDFQIIVFQEAFSSVCRDVISKKLKQSYPFQYGPVNKHHLPFKTNSGLWVVSKMPLKELEAIHYSQSKGYDAVARKGAVIFEGIYENTTFQLVTTHLQAHNSSKIREQQCLEIRDKILDKYYNPSISQIICGDFNIDMDNKTDYPFMLRTLDAKNGEVIGDHTTYDEVYNTLSQERTGKRRTIDYVLTRNNRWIKNIQRKVNQFYEVNKNYTGNLSDHYAMEAEIIFTNESSPSFAMK